MNDLNPHQFGAQPTLFDAPLGQPDAGTFKGNPHARLYRAVAVNPRNMEAVRRSGWGDDIGGSDHDALNEILHHVNRPRTDAMHNINMGIHWQHDLGRAQDYAYDLSQHNRHGGNALTAIIEADHPGLEHVIDTSTNWRPRRESWESPMMAVPPKEIKDPEGRYDRNKLSGHAKDWALVNDTIGPHDMDAAMYPEVPIRPGAPMRVHALHLPDPGSWSRTEHIRNPVQFRGQA
jgi:hypothetical protein